MTIIMDFVIQRKIHQNFLSKIIWFARQDDLLWLVEASRRSSGKIVTSDRWIRAPSSPILTLTLYVTLYVTLWRN